LGQPAPSAQPQADLDWVFRELCVLIEKVARSDLRLLLLIDELGKIFGDEEIGPTVRDQLFSLLYGVTRTQLPAAARLVCIFAGAHELFTTFGHITSPIGARAAKLFLPGLDQAALANMLISMFPGIQPEISGELATKLHSSTAGHAGLTAGILQCLIEKGGPSPQTLDEATIQYLNTTALFDVWNSSLSPVARKAHNILLLGETLSVAELSAYLTREKLTMESGRFVGEELKMIGIIEFDGKIMRRTCPLYWNYVGARNLQDLDGKLVESLGPQLGTRAASVVRQQEVDEKKACILAVATEWNSRHGGLSTFNRELCVALASSGVSVFCYVPHATEDEVRDALDNGVFVLSSPNSTSLERRPPLPEGMLPNVIIGHDRISGPQALALREDFFQDSKLILFIHTAPREIERYKPPERGETSSDSADQRAHLQKQLAMASDVVAAVGPRLYAAIQTELVGENRPPLLARIDPGMHTALPPGTEPQIINCLLFGRAEDDALKGLDIAARALGILHGSFTDSGRRRPQLVIRGAVIGSGDALRDALRKVSGNTQLQIDVRPFLADVAVIRAEVRSAWVVLLPSRTEGFGLVALEAIGQGIPLLVGDQSGIASLLHSQCPDLAPNLCVPFHDALEADASEWARRIEFVLRDRPAALGRASQLRDRLATHLTWDRAAADLLSVLSGMVAVVGR
jgi:glycosyltransferase involved in cell wall biosynthesis